MKRIIISFSVLAALALSSCKKDLLDINQNPNSATFSTPQLTMPVALEGAGRVSQTSYISGLGMWIGYYATSSGFSKPTETYTYDISNTYLAGVWDNLYNNLTDLDYVEKTAGPANLPVYQAIAKIMKAYDYHQLVDLWDNVPYSEALKGSGNFSPKYDKGQDVYEDLIKQLDTAIAILKKPATAGSISLSTDQQKIILWGNLLTSQSNIPTFITRYIKLANTLKLKLLLNQSQMTGRDTYIKQNLSGLTRADFLDLGEDAVQNPGYSNTTGKFNPFYGVFYSSVGTLSDNYKSIKASDYAVKAYLATNDTFRIAYYYDKGAFPYLGSVFGDPSGTNNAASIGKGLLVPDAAASILVSSESLFMQAEAVQRGYITGNAKQLYQDAVLSSFQFDKITNAAANAAAFYGQANPEVNWDLATDKIKLIISQKWFALNSIDVLALYNDYRRTGFPNVPLSTDPNSKGKVPVRMYYPQRESQLNTANVSAQGTITPATTTVFWDK